MTTFTVNAGVFDKLHNDVEFCVEVAKLDFALELKRMMDHSNMKNVDLAERLEVSSPMVSKLLRGDSNVTIETMVKASKAVGGDIFIRIVRSNCTPKLFEVVKAEHTRVSGARKARSATTAAPTEWDFFARVNGNEEKSIAA